MPMLTYLLGESVPGFSCMVTVLSPRSRGTVRLASADPDDVPLVDPGYYTSPADLDLVGERAAELLRWTWTPGCGSPVGTSPARLSGLRASGPRTFSVGRASVLEGRVPSARQAVSCR
ncbi:GMC oxidoreductase [Streptomyces rubiginosohelvolus]|uniref:GMC oxidoreductase n=1 Tax=Streptomyces rubiginosohelvolus TaxID=67362 RepID=UPI003647EB77